MIRPEPVAFVFVGILGIGALIYVIGRIGAGPAGMTELPRIGQLTQEQLADCGPELYGDHLLRTAAPGFINDPAYHAHQRQVLEDCAAPFTLWARVAAAWCDPPILEPVDAALGRHRPLADALDVLATENTFRDCYRSWLER